MTRPIFMLTDFGTADTYVGIVKAVILSIAPDAPIVDLTHEIPPQDVRAGAFALLTAAPYLPENAVVLAVVDPGVGTNRLPIAVQVGGRTFVGPDNGLLSWAVGDAAAANVVVLDRPEFWLPSVSATFHGRDIFGAVAAQLARGVPLADMATPVEAVVRLLYPMPKVTRAAPGRIVRAEGTVIHVDRYGNLISNLRQDDLPLNPWVTIGHEQIVGIAPNYQADGVGRLIALIGSAGLLEIARPNGSAADYLGIGIGATLTVSAESLLPPTDS